MVNSPMPSIIAIASTLLSRNKYSLKEIGISDFKNFFTEAVLVTVNLGII